MIYPNLIPSQDTTAPQASEDPAEAHGWTDAADWLERESLSVYGVCLREHAEAAQWLRNTSTVSQMRPKVPWSNTVESAALLLNRSTDLPLDDCESLAGTILGMAANVQPKVMANGLTEAETAQTASVFGLTPSPAPGADTLRKIVAITGRSPGMTERELGLSMGRIQEICEADLAGASPAVVDGPTIDVRKIAEQSGIRMNLWNQGAASMAYSEGCEGITREHLEKFAQLYGFACWNAALKANPPNMQGFVSRAIGSLFEEPRKPLPVSEISSLSIAAQIAYNLDKFGSYEEAIARGVEAAHRIGISDVPVQGSQP